ncbi:Putative mutator protein MutT4 [Thermoflexales bacterium]|nr:Putative mutator protein MutT4 [Thermoflexales bacterium]
MTDYITWLRSRIGSRKTILAYATALLRDDQGRILFQQRADFKDDWWGLPGGLLELGESFTLCVQRETLEETGYHVEPVRMIGLYASPEFDVRYPNGDEVQQFTLALECRITGGQPKTDESEIIQQCFFDLNDAPDCLPPWYAAMVRDLQTRSDPYFDPPLLNHANNYMPELRALVGHEPLIVMGASALIFDQRGRILLGLRGDNQLWGSPAGQMELGETPAGTAMRETFEEVGLSIRVTQLVGVWTGADATNTYPDGNQVQIAGARFRAEVVGGELKPDGYETLDVQWFDVNDLPPMVPRHRYALEEALKYPEGGRFR